MYYITTNWYVNNRIRVHYGHHCGRLFLSGRVRLMRSNSEIEYAQLATAWCFNNSSLTGGAVREALNNITYIYLVYFSACLLFIRRLIDAGNRWDDKSRTIDDDTIWILIFFSPFLFFFTLRVSASCNGFEHVWGIMSRSVLFFLSVLCSNILNNILYASQRHHKHIISYTHYNILFYLYDGRVEFHRLHICRFHGHQLFRLITS